MMTVFETNELLASEIKFDRSIKDASDELFFGTFQEAGDSEVTIMQKIIRFLKKTFDALVDWISDLIDSETYGPQQREAYKKALLKTYAGVGERDLKGLPYDYEKLNDTIDGIIIQTKEIINCINKAVVSKDPKETQKLAAEAKRLLGKMPQIEDDARKEYRSKKLCSIAVHFLTDYPGERLNNLKRMCKDTRKQLDTIEKRIETPVSDIGRVYSQQTSKEIRDTIIQLTRIVKDNTKTYKRAYHNLIRILLAEYDPGQQ